MAIVEGIRNTGFFEAVTKAIGNHVSTQRGLTFVLCALCFISSALITNDVALITFVPFSLFVMKQSVSWNYAAAACCIFGAVYFIFRGS
jgi:uncharacterized protein (DUF486 family)